MRANVAAILFTIAACSTQSTTPPTLEVTSPQRGTQAQGDTVTVTGRVGGSGRIHVTVNGTETPTGADGTFSANVTLAPGIDVIETHAIDDHGNDMRDVRAVLAGTVAPTDGTLSSQTGARAGSTALARVADTVATAAEDIDYTAAAQALNPVYDNGGCLGAKVDITSVSIGTISADLVPATGSLDTTVAITNVTVKLHASFKVACIGGSTTITVKSTKATIKGDLGAGLVADKIHTSLANVTVGLAGFSIDVGGVPSQIENLLKDQARSGVEKALVAAIKSKVPPLADKQLAGLVAKPFTAKVVGLDTTLTVAPSKITISTGGLFIVADTQIKVTGGEGGMALTMPAPLSASLMDPSNGLGVAIANDSANQMFGALWAAHAFDKTLPISAVGPLAAILDDDATTLEVTQSLPPTLTTQGTDLQLAIGDMIVVAKDASGGEVQRFALTIKTTLTAGPTQTGKILLTLGTPEVKAQVISQSGVVQRPLGNEEVEGLVTAIWPVVAGQAEDALAKLPMPAIAGIQLGAPKVTAKTGYVLADVAVE
jgi:hypothetical protein